MWESAENHSEINLNMLLKLFLCCLLLVVLSIVPRVVLFVWLLLQDWMSAVIRQEKKELCWCKNGGYFRKQPEEFGLFGSSGKARPGAE